MGLYKIECPQCKKEHQWFSGLQDQRCGDCQKAFPSHVEKKNYAALLKYAEAQFELGNGSKETDHNGEITYLAPCPYCCTKDHLAIVKVEK